MENLKKKKKISVRGRNLMGLYSLFILYSVCKQIHDSGSRNIAEEVIFTKAR